jgi:MFS superfamily sulfate permease-like transporter
VPHFWSQPLIVGLFVLTLLIVLWAPRVIKAIPAPLIAIVAALFTRPPASCCRPSAMKAR